MIVVISDGKPGHLNQSLGLAEALERRRGDVAIREEPALTLPQALAAFVRRPACFRDAKLLIGAGHGTHLSLVALRRSSCPAVVLMRPSLPGFCFDVRVEPRHDGGRESARCWLSDGPLNRVRPAPKDEAVNLILVGGPSPHFAWDEAALLTQLERICDGERRWQLTGSRRTPPGFLERVAAAQLPGLLVHDAQTLPPGWLAQTLATARAAWVTPDSASMVYEALTAGCAVGLLDLPAVAGSRVARAMSDLVARGRVATASTTGEEQSVGLELATPCAEPLAEADRIARRIEERAWL